MPVKQIDKGWGGSLRIDFVEVSWESDSTGPSRPPTMDETTSPMARKALEWTFHI
jgi:hypothetical protein